MTEPELWECEVCGGECRPGEPYCGFDCADAAVRRQEAEDEYDAEPDDPERCDHLPMAWRSCERCKDVYGDLQYQRMKEGEL